MRTDDVAPVLVIDLDETILEVNSFPFWVLFLIGGRLPELRLRQRASLSMRAQLVLLWRKLGRLGHDEFRCRLQAAWRSAAGPHYEDFTYRFQTRLLWRVRSSMQPVLAMIAAEQVDAVLATAATADYAAGLGRRLGFRHILASQSRLDGTAPLNAGAHKRDRVLAFLRERGWSERTLILFTDHLDDLPLMRESKVVCWFGRDDTLAVAQESVGDIRFIRCRHLNGEALCAALWALGVIPVAHADQPADAVRAMTLS